MKCILERQITSVHLIAVVVVSFMLIEQTYCAGALCKGFGIGGRQKIPACLGLPTSEDGRCNLTCDKADRCFSLYSNVTGTLERVYEGCWMEYIPCTDRINCLFFNSDLPMYHCSCCGDYCNERTFGKQEILDNIPLAKLGIADATTASKNLGLLYQGPPLLITITASLGGLAALSIGIIFYCVYFIKRQRHKMLPGSDNCSVETPHSGDTQTTPILEKDRISVNRMDIDLPELAELKARGRFGCVWRAELPDQTSVAVKIFLMQDKASWLNEQDIFNTNLVNNHPFILKFITTATRNAGVEKELWLITEFHKKGSLSDFLYKETMTLTTALKFLKSMANGLAFLHEDITENKGDSNKGLKPAIAHRDFKSKNVLVKSDMTACIADFGLAIKFVPGQNTGESHGQVGTRRYMAPEVLEGAINFQRDAFLRIDMYAFALVSWEVLTRCSDVPGGHAIKYQLPYELEFGNQPVMEVLTNYVVDKKKRPIIKQDWRDDKVINVICETIEECWDNDAEARLPAGCVEERLSGLIDHLNMSSSDLIVSKSSVCPDVQLQNLINLKKNQIEIEKEEEMALINKELVLDV